jgi:hypothetical protein
MEQYSNNTITGLASNINNSQTTFAVTAGESAGFPTSGTFAIVIDAEIMEVQSVAGTDFVDWTVTRASEANGNMQIASAHLAGAEVIAVLTAGSLSNLPITNTNTTNTTCNNLLLTGGINPATGIVSIGTYGVSPVFITNGNGTAALGVADTNVSGATQVFDIVHYLQPGYTAAAGIGAAYTFTVQTSGGGLNFQCASIVGTWSTFGGGGATQRRGRLVFNVNVLGGTEFMRGGMVSHTAVGISFFGGPEVVQQTPNAVTSGFVNGSGTNVTDDATFTGNIGTSAYTIGDIVAALKNYGLLAP